MAAEAKTEVVFAATSATADFGNDANADADDDDDNLMKPALPIAKSGPARPAFDASEPPATGEDYLRRVRIEASKCPAVVVAKAKPNTTVTQSNKPRPSYIPEFAAMAAAPSGLAPSPAWATHFIEQFAALRQHLDILIKHKLPTEMPKHKLPSARDERSWHAFCFGSDISPATPPLLSIITTLDQFKTMHLLSMFTKWLPSDKITPIQSQWIFALLLHVDRLLTADMTVVLRTLCRRCSAIRATLGTDDNLEVVGSLNMIIVIIAGYFEQKDLLV